MKVSFIYYDIYRNSFFGESHPITKKRISNEITKILKSAIANAENNHQLDIDKLVVKEATVGKSMVLKRFRPRARGRSGKILKPFSKVKILVQEKVKTKEHSSQILG